MKTYHKFNFFKHTYCEFEMQSIDFFKEMKAHFQSKSGSMYYYTDNGVFRYSNHWGRVANCRWKIKGIEAYKNQKYYVGYADWKDFYPLNNTDKVFYIHVDFEAKKANIKRSMDLDEDTYFLMTSEFAHQRLKQIQTLFKEYKWATYFDEDIDVLRKRLIKKLLKSHQTIQQLKKEL